MNIKTTPNLQYSDRIGYKSKSRVAEDKVSINNSFYKTPLKRESNDISFKGVSSLEKVFASYNTKSYDLKKNMELLKRSLGSTPEEFYNRLRRPDWIDIRKDIKTLSGDKIQVRTKNWTRLLMEGVVYPIAELPLHIGKSIKNIFVKDAPIERTKEAMRNRSFLQKKMDILNNSDIINSFDGMMGVAEKLKYDTPEVQSSSLFTKAMKRFDKSSGNYNGVHERALTRVVTGFIPAFFLANDAYNLSRLCDDDPKKAKQEHDQRFNQETKRVLSNAYLQLITLGALSKYINSKKWVFALVTAITVLATESFSRISNGKKIHFISKEEAKRINSKNNKTAETAQQPNTAKPAETKAPSFKGSSVFRGFGMAADMPVSTETTTAKDLQKAEKSKTANNEKPLISFEGITKWFATVIIAGFAIKYAKKNVKINNQQLSKYFDVIANKYDQLYEKITKSEYKISKAEFNNLVTKLKGYNEVLASKFESVTEKYQKSTKIKSIADKIAQKLRENGLEEFAEGFEHLANNRKAVKFEEIAKSDSAKRFFSQRDNKIIDKNLQEFFQTLKDAGLPNEAEKVKELLYKDNVFDITNYTKAKNYVEKSKELKPFITTFNNRFIVDDQKEIINMFEKANTALASKNAEASAELKNEIEQALNSTEYTLGKRNRPLLNGVIGWKEITDFATQPFKFIWGTITLPYKHIANPLYNLVNKEAKLPKMDSEIDAVYNGVKKLTGKSVFMPWKKPIIEAENPQVFKKYMDDRINKAFNGATMSSISNADLSALAKNTSVAATAGFLMCDNHNMVMLKSNGEDKDGAMQKAKERAIQETSRTFWNVLFINLFNDTFRDVFNSSLLGAQAVNTASTLVGEYVNRTFIGMPVTQKSKDEILTQEHKNLTDEGIKGNFFRFMSRLTGKKVLSERNQTQKK